LRYALAAPYRALFLSLSVALSLYSNPYGRKHPVTIYTPTREIKQTGRRARRDGAEPERAARRRERGWDRTWANVIS